MSENQIFQIDADDDYKTIVTEKTSADTTERGVFVNLPNGATVLITRTFIEKKMEILQAMDYEIL